jgi:hypothetical protein
LILLILKEEFMNNIGRNDPCPCGSGKKYKNCCLKSKQTPESKEIIWRDLEKASDKLSQILRLYAFSLYGPDLLEAGWKDFIMDFERKYDENTHDYQIFIPWLL